MTAFLTSAKCHPPKQHLLLLDSRLTDVLMYSAVLIGYFFYDIDEIFVSIKVAKDCLFVVVLMYTKISKFKQHNFLVCLMFMLHHTSQRRHEKLIKPIGIANVDH